MLKNYPRTSAVTVCRILYTPGKQILSPQIQLQPRCIPLSRISHLAKILHRNVANIYYIVCNNCPGPPTAFPCPWRLHDKQWAVRAHLGGARWHSLLPGGCQGQRIRRIWPLPQRNNGGVGFILVWNACEWQCLRHRELFLYLELYQFPGNFDIPNFPQILFFLNKPNITINSYDPEILPKIRGPIIAPTESNNCNYCGGSRSTKPEANI